MIRIPFNKFSSLVELLPGEGLLFEKLVLSPFGLPKFLKHSELARKRYTFDSISWKPYQIL